MKRSIIFVSLILSSSFAFAQVQDVSMDMANARSYQQNQIMPPPNRMPVASPEMDLSAQWPDSSVMRNDQSDMARTLPAPPPGYQDSTIVDLDVDFDQAPSRPPTVDLQAQRRSWENDPTQKIRQAGINIGHGPSHGIAHSPNLEDRILLKRWHHELRAVGISDEKIIFEAQRLNKEDFSRWASRFVWWHESQHN